ncbi:aspartic peptidase domain-containing protein [Apiosordaria backusii]|uniref:Aspartic peptidase domain-containing protein n=1 Tax=Apiosordaria backusii TaxID=314023 RepID=A0AA40AAJ3_9PEZI|nr:aspartic peptidase domain-containing protein [Apiosordaria backusii]
MSLVFLLIQCFLFATATSAHLLVPFTRERNIARALDTRSPSVPLAASGHVFVVNVTAGTPAQQLSLLLSPSSPHTWLPDAEAMPCQTGFDSLSGFHNLDDSSGSACKWGAFSASKSSTIRAAEQVFVDFVVAYTDKITVGGRNITDKLTLGDIELDDFSMGLVSSVSNQQWIGMLGLGNDATTLFPRPSSKYRPNFVDQLVSSGKITSQAYSIWLNNAEGTSGSLLLGAIDKSRYEGDLIRLSTAQPYDVFPSAFAVSVANVNVDGDGDGFKYDGPAIAASLSPAESFSYLPDGLADGIMAASGASWNTSIQWATIACDAGSKHPKTSFRFQLEGPDGPILNVRLADLVIQQDVTRWEIAYATLANLNRNTCLFGIQKHRDLRGSNTPQYNLGSSLLRRTYMVFDAANKEVALAPTKLVSPSTKSDIIAFEKTGARIPSSRLYCADSSECTSESNASASGADVGTTTGDAEPNSDWKKIVIGVVVPIGVLAILIPIVYVIVMRRKRQAKARDELAARRRESHTDGEDSFKEDEYGVKVTVSVSSKVSVAKAPPSPQFFLGVPGGFPNIPEDRKSQYSGDALLGPDSRSGSRTGSRNGSEGGMEGKEVLK